MFKVHANFFMYSNLKAKGIKTFSYSYGSYVGFFLTLITVLVAIYSLAIDVTDMVKGRNGKFNIMRAPNYFVGKYNSFKF